MVWSWRSPFGEGQAAHCGGAGRTVGDGLDVGVDVVGTLALLSHHEQAEALREGRVDETSAVEELLLSLGSPYRCRPHRSEPGGEVISVNEAIAVHLPAVNRDPARFTDPDLLSLADADARRAPRAGADADGQGGLRRGPAPGGVVAGGPPARGFVQGRALDAPR
ncbi:hypothetical protein ABZ897_56835 [Nonomuraea sp. NPDC046802]|uniref:hypothetical protein n=1 Tax=Nonomuraea sp. NPDC046802 TaxID=3154919 RepID=UPI0033CDD974